MVVNKHTAARKWHDCTNSHRIPAYLDLLRFAGECEYVNKVNKDNASVSPQSSSVAMVMAGGDHLSSGEPYALLPLYYKKRIYTNRYINKDRS